MVYNRWGRVGIKGQDKLLGPYDRVEAAINEFQTKFFDKTKNHWSGRKAFICKPKCYTWLEMDYSETDKATVCYSLFLFYMIMIDCDFTQLTILCLIFLLTTHCISYNKVSECADSSVGSQLQATKLDQCIAKFISLICNISMMKQQMLEIGQYSLCQYSFCTL